MTKCFSRRTRRRWLRKLYQFRDVRPTRRGTPRLESLEARLFLAGDLQDGLTSIPVLESAPQNTTYYVAPDSANAAEGEATTAEGESAAIFTIADFAKALKDAGVRLFGASWCQFCVRQKAMFGTAAETPYIETTDAVAAGTDLTLNPTGRPIANLPTWEFQDQHRVTGVLTLQQLSENSGIPLPANVVTINTNLADFDIELLKNDAPITVANFLKYTNDGDFDNSIMHRYVSNFVLQGGGFTTSSTTYTNTSQFTAVPTDAAIQNEYKISNKAGTLAMAKLGGNPNSATSQFFINLADNSGNLDNQNGGFTVFAKLVDSGMISQLTQQLTTVNAGGAFTDLPTFGTSQLVVIESIEGSGTVRGKVFPDQNVNGTLDASETALSGVVVYSDANNNGVRDTNELSVTTNASGDYAIVLPAGSQKVRVVLPTGGAQSLPTAGEGYTVNLAIGGDLASRNFGIATIVAPTGLDLLAATDSGSSNSDNRTKFNNSSAAAQLQFSVNGVATGAVVRLFADGVKIGEATGTGQVIVTSNGTATLTDGSHAFTVAQVINGIQGAISSPLNVTIDTTVPSFSSTAPTQSTVGELLSYVAENPEDTAGNGTYSLVNAPTGAVINATTGTMTWTPTAAQVGTHTFDVVFTDAAGNTRSQAQNIQVRKEVLVRLRLEVTNASNNPVTQIQVGDTFKLRAFVQDVRDNPTGVFSFYGDVEYSGALANPAANAITHGPVYGNGPSGSVTIPGLIDEVGSFSGSLNRLGGSEILLYTVSFVAQKSGVLTFTGNAPDNLPAHEIGVYDRNPAIPLDQVDFGLTSVTVAASFTAANDLFNFNEDTTNNVLNVLANDVSLTSATLTVASVGTPASGGTATISPDGKQIRYTPPANYFGEDTFTYQATDGNDTVQATVTVQVFPVNDNPTGVNDTLNVPEDSINNVLDVLANDLITPDANETLEVVSIGPTSNGGVATRGSSGTHILYTPPVNFVGSETFTYTLRDNNGGTSQATVTVTTQAVNDPPTAVNDAFTVIEDSQSNQFNVLQNDSALPDVDETLSVTAVGTPNKGGTVTIASDGKLIYKPAANFFGTETLTYTLSDGKGGTATGTVVVTVTAVNDAPTAAADSLTVTKNTTNNSLNVLANDSIAPDAGETLVIQSVSTSTKGIVPTISADKQRILYTPPANYTGADSFTYTISDGNGGTAQATATISVVDFVPSSLAGFVYYDTDNDGVKDAGEQGASGVTIKLTGKDYTNADVSRQVTTGTDGSYLFDQLAPGNYKLTETQPTGNVNNLPIIDGKDTIGSQGGQALVNDEFTITLAEGTTGINNNFAELLGRRLGGTVIGTGTAPSTDGWQFANVGVTLYSVDSAGKPTGSQLGRDMSDADGQFEFPGLTPQKYALTPESQPFLLSANGPTIVSLGTNDSLTNVVPTRGLRGKYVNYRFFMNSTPRDEFLYASAGTTADTSKWYSAHGSWDNYTNISTSYSTTLQKLTVQVTETSGTQRKVQLSKNDTRVDYLGQEGSQHLFRLNGPTSAFNFQTVSTAASGEGEGLSAAALSSAAMDEAEGEASSFLVQPDAAGEMLTLTTDVGTTTTSAGAAENLAEATLNSQVVLPGANLLLPLPADTLAAGQDDLSQDTQTAAVDLIMAEAEQPSLLWSSELDNAQGERVVSVSDTDAALEELMQESSLLEWI